MPKPPPNPEPAQTERKAVYTIIDREGKKSIWLKLGIAFVNKDGSYNVVLDAYPVNGKLHIRDFPEREEEQP